MNAVYIPVDDKVQQSQSLHATTKRFLTPELFRNAANKEDNSMTANLPNKRYKTAPKSASARMNVLDYLVWLNFSMRLITGQRANTFTREAELSSDALQQETEKSQYPFDTVDRHAIDSAIEDLLTSLPNVDYPKDGTYPQVMQRANAIEVQLNNLLFGRLPPAITTSMESFSRQTVLHHDENSLMPPANTADEMPPFARLRYEAACLLNLILGGPAATMPDLSTRKSNLPHSIFSLRFVSIYSPSRVSNQQKSGGVPSSLLEQKFSGHVKDGGDDGPKASTSNLQRDEPHHDYRIVHSEAVREKAKRKYAQSVLDDDDIKAWCRPHRVQNCLVCQTQPDRHQPLLRTTLARCLIDFLIFSAAIFDRVVVGVPSPSPPTSAPISRQSSANRQESERSTPPITASRPSSTPLAPTSCWYELLATLIIQAVLDGYLMHGWASKEPLEILMGVGCGVFEGRTWGEGTDSNQADEHDKKLIEACRKLFSNRNSSQADFEREMRDRTHEFLNVGENSLASHLSDLNLKYPCSAAFDKLFVFLIDVQRYLALPKLAKLGKPAPLGILHDYTLMEKYVSRFPRNEPPVSAIPRRIIEK